VILAYLKASFPDHTVEVYEDHGVRGHRFVLSHAFGAVLASLIVPTATLDDVRGRLPPAGFSPRLHKLLLHRDVVGKLRAAEPGDRFVFTSAGISVQKTRAEAPTPANDDIEVTG
jgi:hypothetical protein